MSHLSSKGKVIWKQFYKYLGLPKFRKITSIGVYTQIPVSHYFTWFKTAAGIHQSGFPASPGSERNEPQAVFNKNDLDPVSWALENQGEFSIPGTQAGRRGNYQGRENLVRPHPSCSRGFPKPGQWKGEPWQSDLGVSADRHPTNPTAGSKLSFTCQKRNADFQNNTMPFGGNISYSEN